MQPTVVVKSVANTSEPSQNNRPTAFVTTPPGIPINAYNAIPDVSGRGVHSNSADSVTFENTAACWRQLFLLLEKYWENTGVHSGRNGQSDAQGK